MPFPPLTEVAWIGDKFLNGAPRGVIVSFHGLGAPGLKGSADWDELEWSDAGGLCVFPYYGPWSWMNRQARAFVDDLIDGVYLQYQLALSTPLIIIGGSMGGFSALLYSRYARKRPTACCAMFPVCDLKHHFSERPDLPRTIHDAFRGYKEPLDDLFIEHSPLSQAAHMPDIPYFIAHGDRDQAVNKQAHSDRFVAEMRRLGRNIEYHEVPGMGHGDNITFSLARKRVEFVKKWLRAPQ